MGDGELHRNEENQQPQSVMPTPGFSAVPARCPGDPPGAPAPFFPISPSGCSGFFSIAQHPTFRNHRNVGTRGLRQGEGPRKCETRN